MRGSYWTSYYARKARKALPYSGRLLELIAETDARYERCMANGRHRPSGRTVMRAFGSADAEFKVCADCSVPYGGSGARSPYAPPDAHRRR